MIVDEEKNWVLKHSTKKKGAVNYTTSDHNVLLCKLSLKYHTRKPTIRKQFFDFKSIWPEAILPGH